MKEPNIKEPNIKEPRFFSRERKLLLSVGIGWSVFILMVIFPLIASIKNPLFLENALMGLIFCAIFFAIRYSLMKPVLKVGVSGIKTVGLIHILDMAFSRKDNSGAATMGAFIGAALVFMSVLFFNGIKGFGYFIRETVEFTREFEAIKNSVRLKRPAA